MENINKIMSGKVRDVYEADENRLVIVATDRVSAFDVILPKPVKNKGVILTAMSNFWFGYTGDIISNHIITNRLEEMPKAFQKPAFEGRAVMVKKLEIFPFEFVVRGYIFGNMWQAYEKGDEFCGVNKGS